MIDFKDFRAGSYRGYLKDFKPIRRFDDVRATDLLFLDREFSALASNTRAFLRGGCYSHALLTGAKGSGKTSLIKALFNEFSPLGLRLAEIFKEDLSDLRRIIDELAEQPYKFLIFLDDLSFEQHEQGFRQLKPLLDGGIEPLSENLMFVVSSNYLHLVRHENAAASLDGSDEQYALKERFGLWLSFYNFSQAQYLALIDKLFGELPAARRVRLHAAALEFATAKSSRNGRIARQFFEQFSGDFGVLSAGAAAAGAGAASGAAGAAGAGARGRR